MNFETRNLEVSLYGLPENVEAIGKDCVVKWSAEFAGRAWGIDSIDINIIKINCRIDWSIIEDDEEVNTEFFTGSDGFFDIDFDEFEVEEEMTFEEEDGCCQPTEIEIDFTEKTIIVK